MVSDKTPFEQLVQLLNDGNARYRVVHHPSAGRSEEVAKVRGTEVGQGAKALVCELSGGGSGKQWVLAVLPADRKLDKKRLAEAFSAKKVKLADAVKAEALTGCVIGAIPPFSFNPDLQLVVDPELPQRFDTIAFNAGRLDASILLDSADFLRIAQPLNHAIAMPAEPTEGPAER